MEAMHLDPGEEASREELLSVHTAAYLDSLSNSEVIARAVEVSPLRFLPASLLERAILRPMRFATQGTVQAVETALQGNSVFNLGGGFHHAFADHGEGFCIYADAAIALAIARGKGALRSTDEVLIIDLDAHRGNGTEEIFKADPRIHFFDMYNFQVYPGYSDVEDPYIDPVPAHLDGKFYLERLRDALPDFLASVKMSKLAIYNAGTDILTGDPLGRLNVSYAEVAERDRYVIDSIAALGVPLVVLTSGGYTKRSAGLIAGSAAYFLQKDAGCLDGGRITAA